jgi:hypothetical protein
MEELVGWDGRGSKEERAVNGRIWERAGYEASCPMRASLQPSLPMIYDAMIMPPTTIAKAWYHCHHHGH